MVRPFTTAIRGSLIAAGLLVTSPAAAQDGTATCTLIRPIEQGVLRLTARLTEKGEPSSLRLNFEDAPEAEASDGSRFSLSFFMIGGANQSVSDALRLFDESAVISFRMPIDVVLEEAAVLFFSRGNYINFDVGPGKIIHPTIPRDPLIAMDSYRGWKLFADGEQELGWALLDVDTQDTLAYGHVDLALVEEVRDEVFDIADALEGRDLRHLRSRAGPTISCN